MANDGTHRSFALLRRAPHSRREPVVSPGHDTMALDGREGSDATNGQTARLSWGVRTDVGLVRDHNEDSFLVKAPLFAVCDGMGGHAAGEVASSIAVQTLSEQAPLDADDVYLGAAVEAANSAVIEGAKSGKGKAGMGSTCSCIVVSDDRVAIAHVGDSRLYLLHGGTLVRLTHDHSYVEELVDAGEITADEARVHPSRSVITRALGSDPEMYADHFTLNISTGDRLILCSDGLSSMVEDSEIEAIAISSVSPQMAADGLVSAALSAGGYDNVTVVVVDVLDDGLEEVRRSRSRRRAVFVASGILVACAILMGLFMLYVRSSWYLGERAGEVAVYHGINASLLGHPLSEPTYTSQLDVDDLLDQTTRDRLCNEGIPVANEDAAREMILQWRTDITEANDRRAETQAIIESSTELSADNPAVAEGSSTEGDAAQSQPAETGDGQAADAEAQPAETEGQPAEGTEAQPGNTSEGTGE